VLPSIDSVNDGSYPISRALYMYTRGQPKGRIADFLNWIRTDGQILVAKLGFVPIR
jgi:phosphate transport system substrate-binding protein